MARLSVLIVACLTLVGCATPSPKFVPPLSCDGTGRCEVNIINPTCMTNPCSAEVDVDPVIFKRGKNNIPIFWKLPVGYGFCPGTDDGVFLKGPDTKDQFKDPGIDGPDEPGPDACKRKQFKWTARNTIKELKFPYKIRFHNAQGTREYVIDPAMYNE